MTIPKAVSPATLTPGVYVSVDLLAGAAGPGSAPLRVLLLAPKASSGNLTVDTEIRAGGGEATASLAYGSGSVGHLAAKQIYRKYPTAVVDFGAPTAGTGSATLSITASGSPVADQSVNWLIAGRSIDVPWLAGQSADTFKANAIATISSKTTDLPLTASSGGTGVTTLTFKVTGNNGNDCKVRVKLNAAQNGTEAVAGAATLTALSGGSSDPDYTAIATAAGGKEYHYIVPCLSNVDAQSASGTANAKRIRTIMGNVGSGLNAKLQQCIIASTGALSATKVGAIGLNSPLFEDVDVPNALSLPCEISGREAGARLAVVSIDPAGNRIGEVLDGIYGSIDPITDNPVLATSEDALGNGVSLVAYNVSGDPVLIRPITTYSLDASGGADRRCLDVQNVDGAFIVVRDIRDNLPLVFPRAKIMRDVPPDGDPPDIEGVIEERDVRAWVVSRIRQVWVKKGVVQLQAFEAAVADGSLIVAVDDGDETQVNLVIPFKIVKPLAKFGVVGQRFN
ncbi:MAG TPA: hypothetical protein VH062_02220 [Polyangiaceae bacterium]|nr:hypothetical protein [Polyangiaceae bacterium]